MTNNFHKLYSIEDFVCTPTLYRYCWKKASYQNLITNSSCVFHNYNNFCLIALPVSFPFSCTVPFPFIFLSHCEFNIWRFISLWRLENRKHSRFIFRSYLLKWISSPSHKGTYNVRSVLIPISLMLCGWKPLAPSGWDTSPSQVRPRECRCRISIGWTETV